MLLQEPVLCSELETLDHRRARLRVILQEEVVSEELHDQLAAAMAEIEQRLREIRGAAAVAPHQGQRQAA